MTVRQLTVEQKDQLVGQIYDGAQYFNPILDADGRWFISIEEFKNISIKFNKKFGY
jgi:hypothetical protein